MVIRKLLFIFLVEFLLIFCCTTCAVFGTNSTDNKSVQSEDYLNSEVSNVNFDYYHDFYGLNSRGNTVITRHGKLSVLETEKQRESWNSTLEKLSNKIKDTLASKYMYPHGQVVTCGTNEKGYFVILFKYSNVNESLINEIYALIDNSAREMGIHDIPVEFGYGTYYKVSVPLSQDGTRIYNFEDRNVTHLSESEIRVIEEYMKQRHEPIYKGGDVANYGTIPLFKDDKEYNAWAHKLYLTFDHVGNKLNPYMDKDQLRSFGFEATRLEVGIPVNLSYEEKIAIAKEIYPIIDEEARKLNISNVPVTFQSMENYTDTITNPSGNLTLHSSENKSSGNHSVPGFGLLGGLVCLYSGWKLKKK